MTESSTARIRELNDAFRKTFAGGKMGNGEIIRTCESRGV
jgi:hypothetical protein